VQCTMVRGSFRGGYGGGDCKQWKICGVSVRERVKRSSCIVWGVLFILFNDKSKRGWAEKRNARWGLDRPWLRGSFGEFNAHRLLWFFFDPFG